MGGIKPKKTRRIGGHSAQSEQKDPCDISITIDLMGVRADVASSIRVYESLDVKLIQAGPYKAVACVTKDDRIVGSVTAFPGLVQLISCLNSDIKYIASVDEISSFRCVVTIERVD